MGAVSLGALLCALVAAVPALAAGDANQASCANEGMPGFRSYLADCRAYELVSPAASGSLVETLGVSGGGVVLGQSFGGAGGTGDVPAFGATYTFTRGASGWLTGSLNPPASLLGSVDNIFDEAHPIAMSADFGRALYGEHSFSEPSDASNLYVSEPGGAFAEVGPDVPSSALIGAPVNTGGVGSPASTNELYLSPLFYFGGASSDLSHVVFTLYGPGSEGPVGRQHNYLWPGDSTRRSTEEQGLSSLYEYVGTGNSEPKLVGVSDQHALASDSEAHLISQCGTIPGFIGVFGGDVYNAVSADGSTVFFTALHNEECSGVQPPVNELYARVDGEKTVAVSEPSLGYCAGSPSPPCTEAQFAGASADGSRVFFTTEQSLVAGDEGGAGSGNDLYEAEISGGVRSGLVQVSHDPEGPLAKAEVQGVARVSEDGSHVYFVARGVLTSTPNTSLAPGQQVAVAGQDNLYVYERDSAFPAGRIAFVGSLAESDGADWSPYDFRRVDATPDGRFLLFPSSADLTPDDTSGVVQLFRYDAQTGTVVRVSVGQRGFNEDGNTNAFAASIPIQGYVAYSSALKSLRAISDDGQYVFFESADGLTPLAANEANNVYEYHDGEVTLVSDGQDRSIAGSGGAPSVKLVGTDSSGQDVFFRSADQLTPEDGGTQQVVYDARIGGGFSVASPSECSGDGCQGALGGTPALAAAGSATQTVEGSLAPPPVVAPKAKPVSARSKQLTQALRACARQHGKRRRRCEAKARARARGSKTVKSNGRDR